MVIDKSLKFSKEQLTDIANEYGTPLYFYDEAGIRKNAKLIKEAFSWNKYHKNFFAVKALPTPGILRILHEEGMGFDCGSRAELLTVKENNLTSNGVFYSSNNTPDDDYLLANSIDAVINIDKAQYFEQVIKAVSKVSNGDTPKSMAIRYNPGSAKSGNSIIGEPAKSKFGERKDRIIEVVQKMKNAGIENIGLHTMVVSNEKDPKQFSITARLLKEVYEQVYDKTKIELDFINVGGGLGVNYHPDEDPVDVMAVGEAIKAELGDLDIPIYSEYGRYITGPHGYLLTRVTHGIIETYEPFLQVDTSINNLARLATVHAAYHEIDILGRENDEKIPMNVVGSQCSNTDIMFKNRMLPKTVQPNDLMVIHDTGAHSRANSHNYNYRLRAGEVLIKSDGSTQLIRRHETVEDLFATVKGL